MNLPEKNKRNFWKKVDVRGENECWMWNAGRDRGGYGKFGVDGKTQKAHRVSFFLANGYIEADKVAMHLCDNPGCVNPAHLKLGTHTENIADRDTKGRTARGDEHYSRKHPERLNPARGETHKSSKLSDADIVKIFELRKLGWTQQRIADEVGCTRQNISLILNSKSRKQKTTK